MRPEKTSKTTSKTASRTVSKTVSKTTSIDTSRDLPEARPRSAGKPHVDKRGTQEAIVENTAETGDGGRDLVQGEGGTIELPTKPGDLTKDD